MQASKVKVGFKIEVGDYLCSETFMGQTWHKVVRTTEKFAIVQWNSSDQTKFPRVVTEVIHPCGKRDIWASNQYSVWRPVPVNVGTVAESNQA